jgi:large subunit ribosomal protein L10
MPSVLNDTIISEYKTRFGEGPDMVAVDTTGLTVAEFSELRNQARTKEMEVFVVKTSLARIALKEIVAENGLDQVISGPTAVVYGGEGMPDVARLVDSFAKKSGKLAIRGGVFEKAVVGAGDVIKFKDIPDRQTLLSQILATTIAPLSGYAGALNSLLVAPAALADALAKKMGGEGDS